VNVGYDKKSWVLLILLAILLTVLIRTAWLSDDAYITFRTIDNFINGYGLRWNIAERVQAYTHPLWCLLLSAAYFLTHEIYFTSLAISLILTLITVGLIIVKIAQTEVAALLAFIILLFSKAFIDFSTSGLENPLTHLLIVLFAWVYLYAPLQQPITLFKLALIAGFITLNRMDSLLLVLPVLVTVLLKQRSWNSLIILGLGFLPFIAWEIFSLIYYGFLFPNTAYAKLNTGIDYQALIQQGLVYLQINLAFDPITLITILIACISVFLAQRGSLLPWVIGLMLYLLYVVRVGGDFMVGRFLSAPLVIAVIILSQYHWPRTLIPVISLAGLFIFIGLLSPAPSIFSGQEYTGFIKFMHPDYHTRRSGIADERGGYYQSSGLLKVLSGMPFPNHFRAHQGQLARQRHQQWAIKRAIGFFGFYAGPNIHIIDRYALADAFLARLPAQSPWRIGHFERSLPLGYLPSLQQGQNLIQNPQLAQLFEQINPITRGPLLSLTRWQAIGSFLLPQ